MAVPSPVPSQTIPDIPTVMKDDHLDTLLTVNESMLQEYQKSQIKARINKDVERILQDEHITAAKFAPSEKIRTNTAMEDTRLSSSGDATSNTSTGGTGVADTTAEHSETDETSEKTENSDQRTLYYHAANSAPRNYQVTCWRYICRDWNMKSVDPELTPRNSYTRS